MFPSKAMENGLTLDLKELFVRNQRLVSGPKHTVEKDRQFSLYVGEMSLAKRSILTTNLVYHPMNNNEKKLCGPQVSTDYKSFGIKVELVRNRNYLDDSGINSTTKHLCKKYHATYLGITQICLEE